MKPVRSALSIATALILLSGNAGIYAYQSESAQATASSSPSLLSTDEVAAEEVVESGVNTVGAEAESDDGRAVDDDATAQLDIDTLVERLRATRAIGVFTKLALRNDVEALIEDTHRARNSGSYEGLEEVRSRFDGLVLKTVALLDGRDEELARDVYQAREFVWQSILEMQA